MSFHHASLSIRFNPPSGELWYGGKRVLLRPKTGAVLSYLLARRGLLVTREEICQAVWPRSHGSEQAPKQCIRELRAVLEDTSTSPRFIETVGRRGYRFIGRIDPAGQLRGASGENAGAAVPDRPCVGRESELATLESCLARVRGGERRMVFITGEPGIGKSTLINAFIRRLAGQDFWVASGQCVPYQGAAEAYGPLLDVLGQLCRGPAGSHLLLLLERYAPLWLLALPGLADDRERVRLERRVQGMGPVRMRRELVEALEAFSSERPGVVVLEDLHWSDTATLDWLMAWAARNGRGRVLVLASYRIAIAIKNENPLPPAVHELRQAGHCRTLILDGLGEDAVAAYLGLRCAGLALRAELGRLLSSRTEGHPLFLTALLEEWEALGLLDSETEHGALGRLGPLAATVPTIVRDLIEHQFRRLVPGERRLLEAASTAGRSFSAAEVAAGLGVELDLVEDLCEDLVARALFLKADDQERWPNGTVTARYAFRHALYLQVIYGGVPAGRLQGLHRRIGLCLEAGYGAAAGTIGISLAEHFEKGGDPERAARYFRLADETAVSAPAPSEESGPLN